MYQPTMYTMDYLIPAMLRGLWLMAEMIIRWEQAIRTEPPPYTPLRRVRSCWDGRRYDLMGFDGNTG